MARIRTPPFFSDLPEEIGKGLCPLWSIVCCLSFAGGTKGNSMNNEDVIGDELKNYIHALLKAMVQHGGSDLFVARDRAELVGVEQEIAHVLCPRLAGGFLYIQ